VTGLDGRVALVTGAGRGVGRGICLALAASGAAVVVAAHRSADGDEVVSVIEQRGGRAVCVECDVTRRADIVRAVAAAEDLGGLDALIHNAVSGRSNEPVELEEASADLWRDHAAVSITALLPLVQAGHRPLAERRGAVVVLQSPAGIQGSPDRALYAVAKGAQRGFVKSLAREWGPDGIRVNGVAPLAVSPALEAAFGRDPDMERRLAAVIPLGWFGDPEADIGPAVAFLCGDDARYITGQTLVVSGGRFTAL
jgi:NAD(P)-dependent dehydrogenase (short-subunit alcohol dehydrogenase family)